MERSKREPDPTSEELLANAPLILNEVDKAPIFDEQTGLPKREFPMFSRKEIKLGKVLGIGGFGVVREICSFNLRPDEATEPQEAFDNMIIPPRPKKAPRSLTAGDDYTDPLGAPRRNTIAEEVARRTSKETAPPPRQLGDIPDTNNNDHYAVNMARQIMAKRCLRNGDQARYAMKHLQGLDDLMPLERARGRVDLAIEVKYLRALNHPNIVRMRGVMKTEDLLHTNYFFLMDRLYGTLEDKIKEWSEDKKKNKPKVFQKRLARQDSKEFIADLLTERLTIAYDLASAFRYMHEHKLIYRDTKQENIGFDVRGDVKVFDFGLAKSMHPDLYDKDGFYLLTARTGSFPYMAPEIVLGKPYNEKCDVFSYAILVWEILALKPSFPQLKTRREFQSKIAEGKVRPTIPRKWGFSTQQVLRKAWETSPLDRPSMDDICGLLRDELADSSSNDNVKTGQDIMANRAQFLANKSMRSMRLSSILKQSPSSRSTGGNKKQFVRSKTC